jgi:hypothetical protein
MCKLLRHLPRKGQRSEIGREKSQYPQAARILGQRPPIIHGKDRYFVTACRERIAHSSYDSCRPAAIRCECVNYMQ